MVKLVALLSSCLFFLSCGVRYYPLEGNYPKKPVIGYTDKSVDQVCDSIIVYLKQDGMDIKIDSSIGLIISKKSRLSASYENGDGILFYPDSYAVVEMEVTPTDYKPQRPHANIMGDWYFLVEQENKKTSVKISLVNIKRADLLDYRGSLIDFTPLPRIRTTGVFEKKIFAVIQ